jgi:hypothetical protein
MISFATTVFLSAFLLFQIQPIVAEDDPAVVRWLVLGVEYLSRLLPGRAPARLPVRALLHELLSPRRQNLVHGVLLLAQPAQPCR